MPQKFVFSMKTTWKAPFLLVKSTSTFKSSPYLLLIWTISLLLHCKKIRENNLYSKSEPFFPSAQQRCLDAPCSPLPVCTAVPLWSTIPSADKYKEWWSVLCRFQCKNQPGNFPLPTVTSFAYSTWSSGFNVPIQKGNLHLNELRTFRAF